MTKEEEVRKSVKALKRFYMDAITFAFVNIALIMVWLTFDTSKTFWPKYVMLVWGIALIFRGYRMGLTPLFLHYISFLSPDWEEKKIQEFKGRHYEQHKIQLNRDLYK